MKPYLLLLGVFSVFALQAQFIDFGEDYRIQRGDFAVVDIDDDGDLDVIFSGENHNGVENGAVWINDGTGNFTLQTGERIIKTGKSGNIQFGDIDGDGNLDIIFAGWGVTNASKGIVLNDGKGVYSLADTQKYPVNQAQKVTSAGFADFNLDGLLDYYFFANGAGNCIIYFQQPDGTFIPSNESFKEYNFNEAEVTVMDFDNDGIFDIFISATNQDIYDQNKDNGTTENARFSALFKNDGFGNFTKFEGVDIYRKKANGTSSWGDFNGDGYLDLLFNGDGGLFSGEDSGGIVRIYKNINGSSASEAGTFDWYRQNGVGNGSVIVDWNNDGKLDFFVGGWNETTKKQETALYLGDDPDTFTFTKSPLTDSFFPGISEQGFRVADLNGDNKADLLLCGYSGGTMSINRRITGYVLNQSEMASTLPVAPENLNTEMVNDDNGLMIKFSWDTPQSETGKYGTSYNLALRNTTTGKWLYNPMAIMGGNKDGWRKVGGRMGNMFLNKEFRLYDLPAGNYEWTVQAINGAYLGGSFAEAKTFTIDGSSITNTINNDDYIPDIYVSNNNLTVKGTDTILQTLNVYSISGPLLKSTTLTGNITVELSTAGVYIVELFKADRASYRTKVVIK